jgi:hypothetical protein
MMTTNNNNKLWSHLEFFEVRRLSRATPLASIQELVDGSDDFQQNRAPLVAFLLEIVLEPSGIALRETSCFTCPSEASI